MTKDVLVKISGQQRYGGGMVEPVVVITSGSYYLKNGRHYIIYDEVVEELGGYAHSRLRISQEGVDVHKTGAVDTDMEFVPGKSCQTHYETSLGEMVIDTQTNYLKVSVEEDHIHVDIEYSMDINYEHVSDCRIEIDIRSKTKAQLML